MNAHLGSSFNEFLAEDGLLADAQAIATKRIIAFQVAQAMERCNLNKSQLARKMGTSRAAVDRLLDPTNHSVTLHTLKSAAAALGKRVRFDLA